MANGEIQGLLTNPLFNMGVGLLGAGLSRPRTVGQGLLGGVQAGQQFQATALENQAVRNQLRQRARQRNAISQLADTVTAGPESRALEAQAAAGGQQGPTVRAGLLADELSVTDDPQRREMMGLLAQAAPEAFTQGLLGQVFQSDRADPSIIRTLRAAGIDPQSEEGQALIRRSIAGQDISGQLAQLEAMQARLEVQSQLAAVEEARRKAREAEREGRVEQAGLRREIFSQLQLGQEAAELLNNLQGTFGETGFAAEGRGTLSGLVGMAQDAFGGDSSEANRIASQLERLDSIAKRFGFENFEVFSGALSDREVQLALGKDLSVNKTPQANRLAIADRLSIALDQADAHDFEVENREEIEALIRELRGEGGSTSIDIGDGATLEIIE